MALTPFELGLDVVPFFFKYRDAIFGHGFVATVETVGRALCTRENDEFVVAGVEPGGLAASGATSDAALHAFRQIFRAVLIDIAAEAANFDAFHREVHRFVRETSKAVLEEWRSAVAVARTRADQTPDVARVSADMPASVAISYSTDLSPQQNVIDDASQLIAA